MQFIEQMRQSVREYQGRADFRHKLNFLKEHRFWERPRVSTIFNPWIMTKLEGVSLEALVYGEPGYSEYFRKRLWMHQFGINERQSQVADKLEDTIKDNAVPLEERRGDAIKLYTLLGSSPYVASVFSPEAVADIRLEFERSGGSALDTDNVAIFIAKAFANIYGLDRHELGPYARSYAEVRAVLPRLWEVIQQAERIDLWNKAYKGLEHYYLGLHDMVAQVRNLKTWSDLTDRMVERKYI